ncbi:MAG TPA: helix-turn-helix domain-containing protein [Pusillimonas sp.]
MQKRKSPPTGAYAGRRGFNSKSTATAAQQARILALLAIRPHNTEELRQAGIYQVSARIKELRQMGHQIKTDRISLWDRDGFEHRGVALYLLQGGGHE